VLTTVTSPYVLRDFPMDGFVVFTSVVPAVQVRYPNATVDDLIDVIEGTRCACFPPLSRPLSPYSSPLLLFLSVYIPTLYVLNKIDAITIEELDLLDRVRHLTGTHVAVLPCLLELSSCDAPGASLRAHLGQG
jgi:hypothetical protein